MFVPRRSLPPLNAVRAFEAAARLGSFKEAAVELSVTQGAVSQQVRLLEDWLDLITALILPKRTRSSAQELVASA